MVLELLIAEILDRQEYIGDTVNFRCQHKGLSKTILKLTCQKKMENI